MENQEYTSAEIVGFTLNLLTGIYLPVELAEDAGVPIGRAIRNLRILQKKLEEEQTIKEIQDAPVEDPMYVLKEENNGQADSE